MAGESAFEVEGLILNVSENGTCRVQLANGHVLIGFVAGKSRKGTVRLVCGQRVMLQLSPYDLSEGRIIAEKQ